MAWSSFTQQADAAHCRSSRRAEWQRVFCTRQACQHCTSECVFPSARWSRWVLNAGNRYHRRCTRHRRSCVGCSGRHHCGCSQGTIHVVSSAHVLQCSSSACPPVIADICCTASTVFLAFVCQFVAMGRHTKCLQHKHLGEFIAEKARRADEEVAT